VAQALVVEHGMSVQRSCRASELSRSGWYRSEPDRASGDADVIQALQAVVERHGRWGFWKCFRRLRLDGRHWNHKRVWRVYCQLKLNLPRRTKKRLPKRERQTLEVPMQANALWSMDFMADTLYGGRRFRTFNVLDEGVREGLAIEIDTSLRAERVVRVLEQLKDWRGLPRAIRCDNGPEYTAQPVVDWCRDHGIELRYIQPGNPIRTPISNASTRPIAPKCLMLTCSRIWIRYGRSLTPGCNATTTNARMSRSGICRRASIANNVSGKLLLLHCPLDGEGYAVRETWTHRIAIPHHKQTDICPGPFMPRLCRCTRSIRCSRRTLS
jgi:putative transposase